MMQAEPLTTQTYSLQDCPFLQRAIPNLHRARANAVRLYLGIQHKPEGLNVENLTAICAFVDSLQNHPPLAVNKKIEGFAHSFMVLANGSEKIAFISLGKRIHPEEGIQLPAPCLRINSSLMVVFGRDRKVREVVDAVKIFAQFEATPGSRLRELVKRRLLMMQYLEGGTEFPKNFGYLRYRSLKGKEMVAVFQKRASKTLHDLYDETSAFTRINEKVRLHIARQAVDALKKMHEMGVMHRDIKLQNYLVEPGNFVLLTDFEYAAFLSDGQWAKVACGSETWVAPEVMRLTQYSSRVTKELDHWSLGILLYSLTGETHPIMTFRMEIRDLTQLKQFLEELSVKLRQTLDNHANHDLLDFFLHLHGLIGKKLPLPWRLAQNRAKRTSCPATLCLPGVREMEMVSVLSPAVSTCIHQFLDNPQRLHALRTGPVSFTPSDLLEVSSIYALLQEDIAILGRRIFELERKLSACQLQYDRLAHSTDTLKAIANTLIKTKPADRLNLDSVKKALLELDDTSREGCTVC